MKYYNISPTPDFTQHKTKMRTGTKIRKPLNYNMKYVFLIFLFLDKVGNIK